MIPATGLLRLLSGASATRPSSPAPADTASPDFAALLERARAGEIASGREVRIRDDAGVRLTPEQLQRIAVAADSAEAQGATRALVLIDGRAVRLDVTMREITGAADLSSPNVLTDLDAVITTPPAAGNAPHDQPEASVLPLPAGAAAFSNASLLKSLAGQNR